MKTNAEYLKAYRARQKRKGLIRCDVWVPMEAAEAICNRYGSQNAEFPGYNIGMFLTEHFPEIPDTIKRDSTTRVIKRKKLDNLKAKKYTDIAEDDCESVEIPDKDGRCMALNVGGLRCPHQGIEWQPIPNGNRPCKALFCKTHSQIIDKNPRAVWVHSSCLR